MVESSASFVDAFFASVGVEVSEASDVVVGDLVVTSGIDGIYPKGFTLGHIDSVEKSGPQLHLGPFSCG